MKITEFQDLDPPVSDHHTGTIDWFVRVTNNNDAYYIMNDGSETLGDLMHHASKVFYFDTKLEAYEASFAFYVANGTKAYPHFAEWMDEKNGTKAKITNNGIQSQHMRFD